MVQRCLSRRYEIVVQVTLAVSQNVSLCKYHMSADYCNDLQIVQTVLVQLTGTMKFPNSGRTTSIIRAYSVVLVYSVNQSKVQKCRLMYTINHTYHSIFTDCLSKKGQT